MSKLLLKVPPPRNKLVAQLKFKTGAGVHKKSNKAERRQTTVDFVRYIKDNV